MEWRAGYSKYHNEALSTGQGLDTSTEVGIPGANYDDFSSGISTITMNQGSTVGHLDAERSSAAGRTSPARRAATRRPRPSRRPCGRRVAEPFFEHLVGRERFHPAADPGEAPVAHAAEHRLGLRVGEPVDQPQASLFDLGGDGPLQPQGDAAQPMAPVDVQVDRLPGGLRTGRRPSSSRPIRPMEPIASPLFVADDPTRRPAAFRKASRIASRPPPAGCAARARGCTRGRLSGRAGWVIRVQG